MDIKKEREAFVENYRKVYKVDKSLFVNDSGEFTDLFCQDAWVMWQAAKAQAVPDVQQALNDRLLVRSIKEQVESHIAEISVNDLFDKGWFAAMKCIQSNIDMLEAREPAND